LSKNNGQIERCVIIKDMNRRYVVPILVAVTTVPFLLLFLTVDYSASQSALTAQLTKVTANTLGFIGATLLF